MSIKNSVQRLKKNRSSVGLMARASTMGLHLVSGIMAGAAIGYFIDYWFETSPWWFIIFLIIGIIAGFKNLYEDTQKLMNKKQ